MKRPIVFLGFSNSDQTYLPQLKEESSAIYDALLPLHKNDSIKVEREESLDTSELASRLTAYADQLVLFHYAGHATGNELEFEDLNGNSVGLAGLIRSLQKQLQVVFLNACGSYQLADDLLANGVKAVVATLLPVEDGQAMEFAIQFYSHLAQGGTLQDAYISACNKVILSVNDYAGFKPEIIFRNPDEQNVHTAKKFPWALFVNAKTPTVTSWKLPQRPHIHEEQTIFLTSYLPLDYRKDVVGRNAEVDALKQVVDSVFKPVVITGTGGIGKTTLAKTYISKFESQYHHIGWIEQTTNVITSFIANTNLVEMLKSRNATVNLDFSQEDSEMERFRRIMLSLKTLPGKNLLLVDNGNESSFDTDILAQFPVSANFHVIITSRLIPDAVEIFKLNELTEENAIQLFKKQSVKNFEEKEIRRLLDYISYNTLMIEIAAKTLADHFDLSIPELLEHFEKKTLDDEDIEIEVSTAYSKQEITLYKLLIQTFQISQLSEEECQLLKDLAVLPPYQYNAKFLIEEVLGITTGKEKNSINKNLNKLAKKGWLDKKEDSYFLHRMKKDALIYQLKPTSDDVEAVIKSIYLKVNTTNVLQILDWIPYLESIIQNVKKEDERTIGIKTFLYLSYVNFGNYAKANELADFITLDKNRSPFLKDDAYYRLCIACSTGLANANLEKAIELLDKAAEYFEKSDDPKRYYDLACIEMNYAVLEMSMTQTPDYQKIEDHLLKGEELLNLCGPVEDPSYELVKLELEYKLYLNLSTCQLRKGWFDESIEYAEKSLKILEEKDYSTLPVVYMIKNNIAAGYLNKGDFEKSSDIVNEVLKYYEDNGLDQFPAYFSALTLKMGCLVSIPEYSSISSLIDKMEARFDTLKDYYKPQVDYYLVLMANSFYELGFLEETLRILQLRKAAIPYYPQEYHEVLQGSITQQIIALEVEIAKTRESLENEAEEEQPSLTSESNASTINTEGASPVTVKRTT